VERGVGGREREREREREAQTQLEDETLFVRLGCAVDDGVV
jgi:hypothetical protein